MTAKSGDESSILVVNMTCREKGQFLFVSIAHERSTTKGKTGPLKALNTVF